MRIVGLDKHFHEEHVFTAAESVKNTKPAPDLYLHSAQSMGNIDPRHCLAIEDSVVGVTAAKAANMKVLGFIGGKHHSPKSKDMLTEAVSLTTIESLNEILGFLKTV